jgi:hypothetical protein
MKYEDLLDQLTADVRVGRDPEAFMAAYPEHADALRADLALMMRLSSPAPMRPQAAPAMQSKMLAELRAARETASPARAPSRRWLFGGAFGAVAIATMAVIAAAGIFGGIFGSPSTAEAAFDGVVLDNSGGTLTIQTSNSVETVTASAKPGGPQTGALQPGTFVSVKGTRLNNGKVALSAIDQAALTDWCDGHGDQCLQLKTQLDRQVQACQRQPSACAAVAARLSDLNQKLEGHTRQLLDLEGRCQQGNNAACQQLKSFCNGHGGLCARIKTNVKGIGASMVARLQSLRDACASDAGKCSELKAFCTQRPEICAAVRKELQDLQDSLKDRRAP